MIHNINVLMYNIQLLYVTITHIILDARDDRTFVLHLCLKRPVCPCMRPRARHSAFLSLSGPQFPYFQRGPIPVRIGAAFLQRPRDSRRAACREHGSCGQIRSQARMGPAAPAAPGLVKRALVALRLAGLSLWKLLTPSQHARPAARVVSHVWEVRSE